MPHSCEHPTERFQNNFTDREAIIKMMNCAANIDTLAKSYANTNLVLMPSMKRMPVWRHLDTDYFCLSKSFMVSKTRHSEAHWANPPPTLYPHYHHADHNVGHPLPSQASSLIAKVRFIPRPYYSDVSCHELVLSVRELHRNGVVQNILFSI